MERLPRPRPRPGQASPAPAVGDRSAQHLQARGNGRDRPRLSQHRPREQPGRRGSRRPRRRSRHPRHGGRPHPSGGRLTRREPKNNKDHPMKTVQKRILVTGGAGFLGSHLCERLSARGHDILCADNYFTGRKDNIAHLLQEPNFEAMRHDITFPLYVEVDEIYNLACPASPIHYQFDPVQTTKTSVIGAINMLGLAKRVKAKILQASTSEVYGDPTLHPQQETYRGNVNPTGPRSTITHTPLPVDDPIQRCPDISQAKSVLKWEPRTPLKPGLERTIAYFDKLLRIRGEIKMPEAVVA